MLNEDIKGSGTYLTEMGIHAVLAARQGALARQARLQWSLSLTEKILARASASPYSEADTLPQIINDWFEVILYIQNQTSDFIADDDILRAVADYYDNYCKGDSDLLRGKCADRMIRNFRWNQDLAHGAEYQIGAEDPFDDEEEPAAEAEEKKEEPPLQVTEPLHVNSFVVREPEREHRELSSGESSGESRQAGADTDAPAEKMPASPHPKTELSRKYEDTDDAAHALLAVFKRELEHYVGEGGTSVSERTARTIFASVQYTVNLAKDSTLPMDQRFRDGQKMILTLTKEAKQYFDSIAEMQIQLPLDTYYGTLYREIPNFFRLYDPQYAAQEAPSLMDYPLAVELDDDKLGIVYMHEYLRSLLFESEYTNRISEELISELILAYSRKYDMDITPVPVNFFEILMGQAFSAALILDADGKNPSAVWGTADSKPQSSDWIRPVEAYGQALAILAAKSFSERREQLARICDEVCRFPGTSDQDAVEYAHIYADRWIDLMEGAVENENTDNLILFPLQKEAAVPDGRPSYIAQGEPMNDDDYTELVEKLGSAADVNEQNELIRTNVHSRKDLLDILNEDFWMPGEKESFIATFSPEEQALLKKEAESDGPQLGF